MSVTNNAVSTQNNPQRKNIEDYKTIEERLNPLTTRLDVPAYNEIQQILFRQDCKDLDKDNHQKACRFITDCTIPDLDVCLLDTAYKEAIPPSHPRDQLPIALISEILTCCKVGRIACPAISIYSEAYNPGSAGPTLYKQEQIGPLGKLTVGINIRHEQHCCDEEEYDYINILPSMMLDFDCSSSTLEASDSVSATVDLTHEKLTVKVSTEARLNICDSELVITPYLSLNAIQKPFIRCHSWENCFSEEEDAQLGDEGYTPTYNNEDYDEDDTNDDTSRLDTSSSCAGDDPVISIYGTKLSPHGEGHICVSEPNGAVSFTNDITIRHRCNTVVSSAKSDSDTIDICYDGNNQKPWMRTKVKLAPKLNCDGTIDTGLEVNTEIVNNAGFTGTIDAATSFEFDNNNVLNVKYRHMSFKNGILCSVDDDQCGTAISYWTKNIVQLIHDNFHDAKDCAEICACTCSDSSDSSSSSDTCCTELRTFNVEYDAVIEHLPSDELYSRYDPFCTIAVDWEPDAPEKLMGATTPNVSVMYTTYDRDNVDGNDTETVRICATLQMCVDADGNRCSDTPKITTKLGTTGMCGSSSGNEYMCTVGNFTWDDVDSASGICDDCEKTTLNATFDAILYNETGTVSTAQIDIVDADTCVRDSSITGTITLVVRDTGTNKVTASVSAAIPTCVYPNGKKCCNPPQLCVTLYVDVDGTLVPKKATVTNFEWVAPNT